MTDAAFWGAVWAMFAVIAGFGLAVAAIALFKRAARAWPDEYTVGYNLLATQFPAQSR
ncbi:MAG TPA: hypothetical protein PLN53_12420 [Terricaulis sp.]|nr:hypothetical protein [Terricaulis sp.]